MNTISYKDLKNWYLDNEDCKANAKEYFGNRQPSIFRTGFYSSPSWNWGYEIGITGVDTAEQTLWFEVVTQFGEVVSARPVNFPVYREYAKVK